MADFRLDRFTWQDNDLTPVSEGEGDEMQNPLSDAPDIEAELDSIEEELGPEESAVADEAETELPSSDQAS